MTTLLDEKVSRPAAGGRAASPDPDNGELVRIHRLGAETGIWLASSISFASRNGLTRLSRKVTPSLAPAMARILHSGLSRVLLLASEIHSIEVVNKIGSGRQARKLYRQLREAAAIGGSSWERPFSAEEFLSWCGLIKKSIEKPADPYRYFIRESEQDGELFGRIMLERLSGADDAGQAVIAEIKLLLGKFGTIFRYLEAIEDLMGRDEPLKPGVLVFANVEHQCSDLLRLMEARVPALRAIDERLAEAVDGAAYISSIETKKVFDHELAGILEIRPAPVVFARFESAHALLKEGFQQTVASILRHLDDSLDAMEVYPSLRQKRDDSFLLRREMKSLADAVAAAESGADPSAAEDVQARLADFLAGPVRFLFFKDIETVERFAEEIELAAAEGELQPILHRFSAFLETLIGQVGLRAVLADEKAAPPSL